MGKDLKKRSFIVSNELFYPGVFKNIRKSTSPLQPLFEAFTNSWESIIDSGIGLNNGSIEITLDYIKDLNEKYRLNKVIVQDNGIGFDSQNFERFSRFRDFRKGYNNHGTGRFQLIHSFEKINVESIYREGDEFWQVEFIFSKSEEYCNKNALIFFIDTNKVKATETKTTVEMINLLSPLDDKFFSDLSLGNLKEEFVNHYILLFCTNKERLPKIVLKKSVNDTEKECLCILEADIPNFDKEDKFEVPYSYFSDDKKDVLKSEEYEEFNFKAFKLPANRLKMNEIKLASKNEAIGKKAISFQTIKKDDIIKGNRYLVLISSDYIDRKLEDDREEIEILSLSDFKKNRESLFLNKEILINDIDDAANIKICSIYKEIQEEKEKHQENIEALKEMFLISETTLKEVKIGLNDTSEKILEKVYEVESRKVAQRDAVIKQQIDKLDSLNPAEDSFEEEFQIVISELAKEIPMQNRAALTHYVARRNLVLEIFQKVLDKKLNIQEGSKRDITEKILHNLIFRQHSSETENSNLWLINDDFMYFSGLSEFRLGDATVNGKTIFKEELTNEEEDYRLALGEDRYQKRPDILLFPDEGKCIIIEFKNPDVNVSDHLGQINKYASWIRNFSKEDFDFHTFYGYFIGEAIDKREVRDVDPEFVTSYHLDFLFRPARKVPSHDEKKPDGTLYTEVIKYSDILERAKKRNKIFIEKIIPGADKE